MTEIEHRRQQRKKHTAEEFTNPELVNKMLDKLPKEIWEDPTKSFLDPSGGDGAFMIEILKRKLSFNHDPLIALSTIFSVELMLDNVEEMKSRLLELIPDQYKEKAIEILNHNIICSDAFLWDFENWCPKDKKQKALF